MRQLVWQTAVGASAVAIALLAPGPAAASDLNQVRQATQSGRTVRVLAAPPKAMLAGGGTGRWSSVQQIIDEAAQAQTVNTRMLQAIGSAGGRADQVHQYRYLPFVAMTVDARAVEAAQRAFPDAQMWQDELNFLSLADSEPQIGAPSVWAEGHTGKGQIVAVIDCGTDSEHVFLKGKIMGEACFAADCPNGKTEMIGPGAAAPVDAHGTHVAGIAAGAGSQFAGVAREAQILAINVFPKDENKGARDSDILKALDYVLELKITQSLPIASVNMSLGGGKHTAPCKDSLYEDAAQRLVAAGTVVVAASGNEKLTNALSRPACAPSIVSVGAVDKQTKIAGFSNSASFLSVLAPGVAINSSFWKPNQHQGFERLQGTSMAAPHIAGAFAVLRQVNPGAKVEDLIAAMKRAGKPVTDQRNGVKTPFLDLAASVKAVQSAAPAPQPAPQPSPRPTPPPRAEAPPPAPPPAPAPPRPGGMRPVIE